jgi:hypothetical protein
MSNSVLVKRQVKQLVKENVTVNGQKYERVVCNIRHDDQRGNGHNTFAITGEFYENQREINRDDPSMCGCCHDELSKVFPEIKHLIKWHLVSSDSPMHYIANTTYHASQGALDYARNTAIWPDATLEQLLDKDALQARLPALMSEFRKDVEEFGFTF